MKKLLLLALLFTSVTGFSQSSKTLAISGTVKGIKDTISKVYLRYASDGAAVSDSALITAGKFNFKGTISAPVQASVYVKFYSRGMSYDRDLLSIFIQPGVPVTITCMVDCFSASVVKGGPMIIEYQKIK